MRRYLVVANQTLGGAHLAEKIGEAMAQGPCRFHVVVPATPPGDHVVWTEGEAHAIAGERLRRALEWLRSMGAEATGEIGDPRPLLAIRDVLYANEFDEIVLSTLPAGLSRWLRQDLPARVRRAFGIPVSHVIGEAPKHHAKRSA